MFGLFKSSKSKTTKNVKKSNKTAKVDEAIQNARVAKAHIGDETVQKIAQSVQDMEMRQAKIKKAKSRLASEADAEMVAHEILEMMKNKTLN